MIDRGAAAAHLAWVGPLLLVAAALTGGGVLNAVGRMTFGWGTDPDPHALTPGKEQPETEPARGFALTVMATPPLALIGLAFAVGFIHDIGPVARAISAHFIDRTHEAAVVLGGVPGTPLATDRPLDLTAGAVSGLLAGALALGFASLGLFAHRARRLWKVLEGSYTALMRVPHAWHSGIVNDYVAWLVFGTAALGSGLLALLK